MDYTPALLPANLIHSRYLDAADEDEVIGRLEEVVEPTTKEEIDAVVQEQMMVGQVTEQEVKGDNEEEGAADQKVNQLPDPILEISQPVFKTNNMDNPEEEIGEGKVEDGNGNGYVVINTAEGDGNTGLQNVIPNQGEFVHGLDNSVVANINFVQQAQDGTFIYNQTAEGITLENFHALQQHNTGNIATLVVDGNQVVNTGDDGTTIATLISGGAAGQGTAAGQQNTVQYVTTAPGTENVVTGDMNQLTGVEESNVIGYQQHQQQQITTADIVSEDGTTIAQTFQQDSSGMATINGAGGQDVNVAPGYPGTVTYLTRNVDNQIQTIAVQYQAAAAGLEGEYQEIYHGTGETATGTTYSEVQQVQNAVAQLVAEQEGEEQKMETGGGGYQPQNDVYSNVVDAATADSAESSSSSYQLGVGDPMLTAEDTS